MLPRIRVKILGGCENDANRLIVVEELKYIYKNTVQVGLCKKGKRSVGIGEIPVEDNELTPLQ